MGIKGLYTRLYILCCLSVLMLFVTGAKTSGIHKEKAGFIQKLEQGGNVKIAALGTSLTGGTWRWLDVMKEWLDEAYPGQVSYLNLGVGASASMTVPAMKGNQHTWNKCGVDRIPEAIAARPDVVFIEFTVNDAYLPYDISVNDSRKNLAFMINSLKEADAEVEIVLQTMNVILDMPEVNHTESAKRPDLTEYIRMYRQVAKKYNVLLIDHYPNWKKLLKREGRDKYLELVTDGVHPNLEGYRKILLPELKKQLLGKQGLVHYQ
jgi:lysophospholipase L1-like esterase